MYSLGSRCGMVASVMTLGWSRAIEKGVTILSSAWDLHPRSDHRAPSKLLPLCADAATLVSSTNLPDDTFLSRLDTCRLGRHLEA